MAGNSKDSKIFDYKDTISQLNITLSAQAELIKSLQKTLEADRLEKENFASRLNILQRNSLALPAKRERISMGS